MIMIESSYFENGEEYNQVSEVKCIDCSSTDVYITDIEPDPSEEVEDTVVAECRECKCQFYVTRNDFEDMYEVD